MNRSGLPSYVSSGLSRHRRHASLCPLAVCLFALLATASAIAQPAASADALSTDPLTRPAPFAAHVLHVGFPRAGFQRGIGSHVAQAGRFAPMLVEVANRTDKPLLQARVLVRVPDADGDLLSFAAEVSVPPASTETFTLALAALPGLHGNPRGVTVHLVDQNQNLLASSTYDALGEIHLLTDGRSLCLVISDTDLYPLNDAGPTESLLNPAQQPLFTTDLAFARTTIRALPADPRLLEGIDCIVWENARFDALLPGQAQALLTWVRAGGWLVVCPGAAPAQLPDGHPMLPLLAGRSRPGSPLRATLENDGNPVFVPLQRLEPADSAAVVILQARAEEQVSDRLPALLRRRVELGSVSLAACSWSDLMQLIRPADRTAAAGMVLGLSRRTGSRETAAIPTGLFGPGGMTGSAPLDLAAAVRRPIDFTELGGAYMAGGLWIALIYVLLNTLVLQRFLSIRQRLALNWPMFAAVGLVGSAILLTSVLLIRGSDLRVQRLDVWTLHAGESTAHAWSVVGVLSGVDQRVDVALEPLPGQPAAWLSPVVPITLRQDSFPDPVVYRSNTDAPDADGGIAAARLRGTLKQFAGTAGVRIDGSVHASLRLREGGTMAGQIRNSLGVDLQDALLIWTNEPRDRLSARLEPVSVSWASIGEIKAGEEAVVEARHLAWLRQAPPERTSFSQRYLEAHADLSRSGPANASSLALLLSAQRIDPSSNEADPPGIARALVTHLELLSRLKPARHGQHGEALLLASVQQTRSGGLTALATPNKATDNLRIDGQPPDGYADRTVLLRVIVQVQP